MLLEAAPKRLSSADGVNGMGRTGIGEEEVGIADGE